MEEMLKLILAKLDRLDRLERLETLVEESHLWLRTLVESKEFQKAGLDCIKIDLTRVDGVLTGFDKSLEIMKSAIAKTSRGPSPREVSLLSTALFNKPLNLTKILNKEGGLSLTTILAASMMWCPIHA